MLKDYISTKDPNEVVSADGSGLYLTAVITKQKIDDDVLKMLPDVIDLLQTVLNSGAYVNPRDTDFYIDNMRQGAEQAYAWQFHDGRTAGIRRAVIHGMAALLNRPVRKTNFKSPTGIEVSAEQVEESGGRDVGMAHADKGDWIVHRHGMTDLVYDDAEFHLLFTPLYPLQDS